MSMHSISVTHAERDRPKRACFIKMRLLIAIMATLCPVVCYIGRQNLPLAIVSMVRDDATTPLQPPSSGAGGAGGAGGKDQALDTVLNPTPLPDSVLGNDLGLLDSLTNTSYHQLNVAQNQASTPATAPPLALVVPAVVAPVTGPPTGTIDKGSDLAKSDNGGGGSSSGCPVPGSTDEFGAATGAVSNKARTYGPKYDWSQEDRALLLGAFFYTYVIFQIPGARLAERIGAKWILAAASSGTAILSLGSPWAASQHVYLLWLARLLMGAFQAAIYPSCYVLYSKWLPPLERSQGLPVLGVGAFIGSIIASGLAGYYSEQPTYGWEWAFYVPGILCAVWSIIWIWFASNEPSSHKFISIEELRYIETSIAGAEGKVTAAATPASLRGSTPRGLNDAGAPEMMDVGGGGGGGGSLRAKKDISWRKLFTSRSIWIMMVAFFASNWSFTIVLLLVPTYLANILQVMPMENGMINSVIYTLFCVSSPIVGTVSTMMMETRACGLSRLSIRKLFQCSALFGQAACFLAITWLGCDARFVAIILFTQIVFYSLVNGGEVQLPAELSPDFSGTIYAIGNCVGSSTGFIVPQVFSLIVTDSRNQAAWNIYFYLAALITSFGALTFLLFGQNKMQDFSKDLGESQLDFGQLGLTGATKGSTFSMMESQHQRSPSSIRVLPPLSSSLSSQRHGAAKKHERQA